MMYTKSYNISMYVLNYFRQVRWTFMTTRQKMCAMKFEEYIPPQVYLCYGKVGAKKKQLWGRCN